MKIEVPPENQYTEHARIDSTVLRLANLDAHTLTIIFYSTEKIIGVEARGCFFSKPSSRVSYEIPNVVAINVFFNAQREHPLRFMS